MNGRQLTNRQKGLASAILTATCWSFLALILKYALQFADSYTIVWYRMLVAFITLLFWFIFTNQSQQLKILTTKPGLLLLASLALGFNYVGFMQGVHYTSPANAQIFIQLGPLLLAVGGLIFFKEKLRPLQKLGFVFCTLGFSLFFWDRMDFVTSNHNHFFLGLTWIIAAATTWALFATLQKKLLQTWGSGQINLYVFLVSTLMYIPFVNWQSVANLPWYIHIFFIFLGLNSLLAYGCLSVALRYLPATQVSPILTTNPLITLLFINIIAFMEWTFIPADPIGIKGYLGAIGAITGIVFVIAKKKLTKV